VTTYEIEAKEIIEILAYRNVFISTEWGAPLIAYVLSLGFSPLRLAQLAHCVTTRKTWESSLSRLLDSA
jgi:hypothetical protein